MELRHLRYFIAVAEEGSLSRAAERLGIQQPPLGQQIRALEAELGLALFDRSAKRVQLNASGAIFLEGARRALSCVGEAVDQVVRYQRGEQGVLALGYTFATSLHELAPRLIQAFLRSHALVQIEVQESDTYDLIVALQQRKIDVACIHTDVDDYPDLTSIVLDSQPMIVAMPVNHRLARQSQRPVSLKRLAQEGFVSYHRPEGPSIYKWILQQFQAAGLSIAVVDTVYRLVAAINLVAAGRGISIVPASLAGLHSEAIVYRSIDDKALLPLPFRMVYRKSEPAKLVQNFVAMSAVLQTARALESPAPRR